MQIGKTDKLTPRRHDAPPTGVGSDAGERSAGGRALVALAPVATSPPRPRTYRQTEFIAQLLATKDQHPQTRERRRAEPGDALAAYRAAAALTRDNPQ